MICTYLLVINEQVRPNGSYPSPSHLFMRPRLKPRSANWHLTQARPICKIYTIIPLGQALEHIQVQAGPSDIGLDSYARIHSKPSSIQGTVRFGPARPLSTPDPCECLTVNTRIIWTIRKKPTGLSNHSYYIMGTFVHFHRKR